MPRVLDTRQQILLEGLVHVADSVAAAYHHIYETALKCGRNGGPLPSRDRAMMFNCAWSIVDDLYAARTLIDRLFPDRKSRPGDFLDVADEIGALRNKMDHLAQNVGNLANVSGDRRPIFGAFSFFYVAEGDVAIEQGEEYVLRGRAFHISAGAVSGKNSLILPMPSNGHIDTPLDHLLFSAFDRDVDFRPAILKFRDFINELGDNLERLFQKDRHLYEPFYSSPNRVEEFFGAVLSMDFEYSRPEARPNTADNL